MVLGYDYSLGSVPLRAWYYLHGLEGIQVKGNVTMTKEELLASIEIYQTQLEQIQGALDTASNAEKIQLQELQANLLQLLDLTLQQLNEKPNVEQVQEAKETAIHNKLEDHQTEQSDLIPDDEKKLDDEFALFQSEIAALSGGSDDEKSEPKHQYSKEGLEELVGTQCRSPFTEKWGGHSYHNAIVLSVVTQEDGEADLDKPEVRVLFSQPTCLEMLPCRYFLSGRCKFSEDECRFSHGKIVSISDIKEHRDPEYDTIVTGSRVLVQYSSDLWTSATVQDVLEDRSAFCIKYDKNKELAEVQLTQMVPLQCEENDEDRNEMSNIDDASDPDSSEDERAVFVPTDNWFQHTLSQRLGDWEKHTKGIGSKLMEKMGYVVGTGLGPEGEGRVEPVTAYVYPQGVSLDRCMELREASNGEELLNVEKRLDRERRKEEAKSTQAAERLKKRTSVFDIINKKLAGKGPNPEDSDDDSNPKPVMNVSKSTLQKDSTKDLNMKNYQLSENIRQLRKEVEKMESSRERQSGNKAALSVINSKIESKKIEIQRLQEAEKKVQGEQQSRRDRKKFCVF
nr:zinc finger CCCH-type with G patch domain-containing protein-like isoform X1 [Procambarus clarkii]